MYDEIKINNLAILRVFALSLVVLRHSFSPFTGAWDLSEDFEISTTASILGNYIATISMPLYVFISGVLFSFLRNKLNKYPTFEILLQKKIKRLIIPYLFFAPIYILIYSESDNFLDFLAHFFQGAGHLWFLLMIFIVFVLFYLAEAILKKHPLKGFVATLFLFFLFPGFHYIQLDPIAKAFQYLPYFYVGYFFYYKTNVIFQFLTNKIWLMIMIHSFVFILSLWITHRIDIPLYNALFRGYILLPMGLLSISVLFIVFYRLGINKHMSNNPFLGNINNMSYYIYILHQPLLMTLFGAGFIQNLPPIIVIFSSFIGVFFASLIIANIIMRFKIGKRLIGAT